MNGIIFLHKEKGMTSHDAISILKRVLKTRKIGHTGTLDKMASGLLIVCVGKATKLVSEFLSLDKSYEADIELGYETNTNDKEGEVTETSNRLVTLKEVQKVLLDISNSREQTPPIYSAISVGGKRSYREAMKGKEVSLAPREIKIYSMDLLSFENNIVKLRTKVSKGTYIRSIARDLGRTLGTYGTLIKLIRLDIDKYDLKDSYKISKIEEMVEKEDLSFLQNIEDVYSNYEKVELSEKEYFYYTNGNHFLKDVKDGIYLTYYEGFKGLSKIYRGVGKAYKYFNIDL